MYIPTFHSIPSLKAQVTLSCEVDGPRNMRRLATACTVQSREYWNTDGRILIGRLGRNRMFGSNVTNLILPAAAAC
jgi:hypothetical protein